MFGIDSTELIIVAIAALIFIGPKDLPRVMRTVGQWVGRARGMARHFTAGIENIMREAELEEMERKWREENARIMAQFPTNAPYPEPGAVQTAAPAASHQPATEFVPPEAAAAASAEEPSLPLDLPRRELP